MLVVPSVDVENNSKILAFQPQPSKRAFLIDRLSNSNMTSSFKDYNPTKTRDEKDQPCPPDERQVADEHKFRAAQEACRRLDFKTAHNICNQVSNSNVQNQDVDFHFASSTTL